MADEQRVAGHVEDGHEGPGHDEGQDAAHRDPRKRTPEEIFWPAPMGSMGACPDRQTRVGVGPLKKGWLWACGGNRADALFSPELWVKLGGENKGLEGLKRTTRNPIPPKPAPDVSDPD